MIRPLAAWLFRYGLIAAARMVSRFAPAPTNRAHLVLDPADGDECDAFQPIAGRDCAGDGHYLCRECGCFVDEDRYLEEEMEHP